MKYRSLLLLASVATIAACSTTEPDPQPTPPTTQTIDSLRAAKQSYDSTRGGVQITAIYFDQDSNSRRLGLKDEWIVLQTAHPAQTTGWILNAGDSLQNFALPATINSKLLVYTKDGPSSPTGEVMALHFGNWIWNNSDPDTARLYDDKGALVSTFTYEGK